MLVLLNPVLMYIKLNLTLSGHNHNVNHLNHSLPSLFLFNVNYIQEYKILAPLTAAVFIGTNFGKYILNFIPEKLFNKLFKGALFIIAIRLILTGYL